MEEIRILLVGKTGSGKSSVGNTILGKDVFKVDHTSQSCTLKCQREEVVRGNTRYVVVDTPGIYDTNLPTVRQMKELIRAVIGTQPGFHIIAFVMKRGDKYTEEIKETQKRFYEWFGNDVDQFSCLILTNTKDQLEKNIYLANPHQHLGDLLERTGNRLAIFENNGLCDEKEKHVDDFLEIVKHIIAQNNDNCFTNLMYQLYQWFIENIDTAEICTETYQLLKNIKQTDGFLRAMSEYERAELNSGGASVGRLQIFDETGEYETENIKLCQDIDQNRAQLPGKLKIFYDDGSPYQPTNSAELIAHDSCEIQAEISILNVNSSHSHAVSEASDSNSSSNKTCQSQHSISNSSVSASGIDELGQQSDITNTQPAVSTYSKRSGRMFASDHSDGSNKQSSLVNSNTGLTAMSQSVENNIPTASTRSQHSGQGSASDSSHDSNKQPKPSLLSRFIEFLKRIFWGSTHKAS